MNDHPQRASLHNEVHARPRPPIAGAHRISHVALLREPGADPAPPPALRELCLDRRVTPPAPELSHFFADLGGFRVKWERHGEFDDFTIYRAGADAQRPFAEPALAALPPGWTGTLPGRAIAAVHLTVLRGDDPALAPGIGERGERVAALFDCDEVLGSRIADGAAAAFTDLRLAPDGFARFLVLDESMSANHAGRTVQRLVELEVYRLMAMLAFPVAHDVAADLDDVERALGELVSRLESARVDEEPALLGEVIHLAGVVERLAGTSSFRFSAARAYHALVRQRGAELREDRLPGLQTITAFLERRFGPAMAYCESVSGRLDAAAGRIARASDLLRTRVEIERERQNHEMLGAMNRRAQLQLRLQETVEGLSVAAITYYAAGLVGYVLKAAKAAGAELDVELATGVAVVPIAVAVALGVRHVRRSITRRLRSEPPSAPQ